MAWASYSGLAWDVLGAISETQGHALALAQGIFGAMSEA